jgi:ketosteroid isomerase-like protein
MAATEPGQVINQFAKFYNSGDLESLIRDLYEDDAMIVPEPGSETASGKAAIHEVLSAFMDMKGTIRILATSAVVKGDLALTHNRWRLDIPDGEPIEAVTAEIVRRQPDGTWKYAIDNPWGGAVLDAMGQA